MSVMHLLRSSRHFLSPVLLHSRVWSRSHVDGGRQGSECDGVAEGQAGRSGLAAKSKQI